MVLFAQRGDDTGSTEGAAEADGTRDDRGGGLVGVRMAPRVPFEARCGGIEAHGLRSRARGMLYNCISWVLYSVGIPGVGSLVIETL